MRQRSIASMITALLIGAAASAIPAGAQQLDGQVLFNTHCRNCHSAKKGDHRLGPSVFGIVGIEAGTAEGFANYSGALKGFKWDEATLDKFMENPTSVASNTTMIYPGVKDPAQRKAIIEFLKSSKE